MRTSLITPLDPQFRTLGGLRIRYADSAATRGATPLLTSPSPELSGFGIAIARGSS